MSNQRSCLSYWFPRLVAAGVPVPRTEIVKTHCELSPLLDGKDPHGFGDFIAELTAACNRIGPTPLFLRTGQTSAKHQWDSTCDLQDLAKLSWHVCALVEFSHCCDFFGLPHDVWVVRERLKIERIVTLKKYHDMPLVREARAFIKDGFVKCIHPYWPVGSIYQGLACTHRDPQIGFDPDPPCQECDDIARSCFEAAGISSHLGVVKLAGDVAKAFSGDGAWSVDILKASDGYYVTDMATAHSSYHEVSCPLHEELSKP